VPAGRNFTAIRVAAEGFRREPEIDCGIEAAGVDCNQIEQQRAADDAAAFAAVYKVSSRIVAPLGWPAAVLERAAIGEARGPNREPQQRQRDTDNDPSHGKPSADAEPSMAKGRAKNPCTASPFPPARSVLHCSAPCRWLPSAP
jgi:hypothetical protein